MGRGGWWTDWALHSSGHLLLPSDLWKPLVQETEVTLPLFPLCPAHPLAQHGPVILGTTQCPAGALLGGSGRGGEAARETWHVSCSTWSCGRCRAHPKPLTGITISLPQSRHLRLSPLACQLDSQRRQTQDSGKICNECSRAQVGMVLHSDDCLGPSLWEPSWGS